MENKTSIMVVLTTCALSMMSCGEKDPCLDGDPWGLVGEWNGQERITTTENGQQVGSRTNAYRFVFNADKTGRKTHVSQQTATDFQWISSEANQELAVFITEEFPDRLKVNGLLYDLVERTADRIVLSMETWQTRVLMPMGDTLLTTTRTELILEKD